MGKRERRRKREQTKKGHAAPASVIIDFPREDPRLRVVIKAGQSKELQEVATKYWEITEDGKWSRTVGSIGEQQWVAATATAISHAVLLRSLCANCEEPIRVINRSWAIKVGGKYLDRVGSGYICPECSDVHRQSEERKKKLELEAARVKREEEGEAERRKARKIEEFLAEQDARGIADSHIPMENPMGLLLYSALVSHISYRSSKSLPSLDDLDPMWWTGDVERDREALISLYRSRLIAVSSETPREVFVISDGSESLRFYPLQAKWRLVGGNEAAAANASGIRRYFITGYGEEAQSGRRVLADLVEYMEVVNVTSYLDGLLTKKYNYPSVPEGRRQDLSEAIKKGLIAGYTPGQMICFAWRAADSAAAWKERNAHMGPPEASSGAVTILNNKVDTAIELHHAIPEYDVPRWHRQPLALAAIREISDEVNRVYDRSSIDSCPRCDYRGFRETDAGAIARCTHELIGNQQADPWEESKEI